MKLQKGPSKFCFLHVNEWEMGLWTNIRAHQYFRPEISLLQQALDVNRSQNGIQIIPSISFLFKPIPFGSLNHLPVLVTADEKML